MLLLDIHHADGSQLLGSAALMLALAAAYWLVRHGHAADAATASADAE